MKNNYKKVTRKYCFHSPIAFQYTNEIIYREIKHRELHKLHDYVNIEDSNRIDSRLISAAVVLAGNN